MVEVRFWSCNAEHLVEQVILLEVLVLLKETTGGNSNHGLRSTPCSSGWWWWWSNSCWRKCNKCTFRWSMEVQEHQTQLQEQQHLMVQVVEVVLSRSSKHLVQVLVELVVVEQVDCKVQHPGAHAASGTEINTGGGGGGGADGTSKSGPDG